MNSTYILLGLFLILTTMACEKTETIVLEDQTRIPMVLDDNFNLSAFSAAAKRANLRTTLLQSGPFTVLAPSDDAFAAAGYSDAAAVSTSSASVISKLANYHMLDGLYDLNHLLFQFNQEIISRGGKMYATRWVKGQDTVLTVNGSRVLANDIPASNGLVMVLNRVLEPYAHDILGDAIASLDELTLFSRMLYRSGLLDVVNGTGPYTVFAPSNVAMITAGYSSMEIIDEADPAELAAFVRHHVLEERRFVYDYFLTGGTMNGSIATQNMWDGNQVVVRLLIRSGTFNGVSVQGSNSLVRTVARQDILTGNGVLHVINGALQ